jgi:hypothetical protein
MYNIQVGIRAPNLTPNTKPPAQHSASMDNTDPDDISLITQVEPKPIDKMNLLFISHSSTPRDKLDKREIARRAQKNASIRRKHARQLEAARKPKPARLFGDFRHRDELIADKIIIDDDTPTTTPIPTPDTSTDSETKAEHWHPSTAVATSVDLGSTDRALSVRTYLDTSKADPFQTGLIPMNNQMHTVFMWYFNVILPVVEPMPSEREDYSRWAVPLLSTEPALMYALLACMAHDMEQATVVGFGPPTRRNMTSERLHYRVKAVQELNACLADPEAALKPSTLLAVHFLLWQEVCLPLKLGY